MYIRLFHGRETPDEQLDDWGFDGPIIGPVGLSWTYGMLKLHSPDWEDMEHLPGSDDLIHYCGKFYGDIDIYFDGDPKHTKAMAEKNQAVHDFATFKRNIMAPLAAAARASVTQKLSFRREKDDVGGGYGRSDY